MIEKKSAWPLRGTFVIDPDGMIKICRSAMTGLALVAMPAN